VLDPAERSRAGRFHRVVDRDRYVVARGALRFILAEYVAAPPERLRLCTGAHDKPMLEPHADGPDIRFNVSHSHELAICVALHSRVAADADGRWTLQDLPLDGAYAAALAVDARGAAVAAGLRSFVPPRPHDLRR
jgi:4'-phosphopantetheinyl transferase